MRDALSIMDQAIAFGDGTLTLQDALNVTGSVHDEALITCLMILYKVTYKHLLKIPSVYNRR